MEQLLCENIGPGVVVFGRVMGFPWWPGIVGRCPTNGSWKDTQGRMWLFFFNDDSGAWLKIRDMRPFNLLTQEALGEMNRSNPKFKKHLKGIEGACALAHEYMRSPVLPRSLQQYNYRLTSFALEASRFVLEQNPESTDLHRDNGPGAQNTTLDHPPPPPLTDSTVGENRTWVFRTAGHGERDVQQNEEQERREFSIAGGKPKSRKRAKVLSNQELNDAAEPSVGELQCHEEGPVFLTIPLNRPKTNPRVNSGNNTTTKAFADEHDGMDWSPNSDPKAHGTPSAKAVVVEKSNPLRLRIHGVKAPRSQSGGSSSTKWRNKTMKKLSLAHENDREFPETRTMDSSMIKDQGKVAIATHKPEPAVAGAPLHTGDEVIRRKLQRTDDPTSSQHQSTAPDAGDDAGSFSTGSGGSGEGRAGTVAGGTTRAERDSRAAGSPAATAAGRAAASMVTTASELPGGCDLLHGLLERMSALEGHVGALQTQVARDFSPTFGEDASAAALKVAVQGIVHAANAFARSRGYDPATAAGAVAALWSDAAHAHDGPIPEHHVRYMRDAARTLVWMACQKHAGE